MAIPAPARFADLREHLHTAQVDAAYLSHVLEQYLQQPAHMPQHDWFLDPLEDHQAWDYRTAILTFQQMIVAKPDEGNGE
jgi:hypothetical protein